jgi:valyl-tRNA synthetase
MFDEELCNQGKRLPIKFGMHLNIKGWEVSCYSATESSKVAIEWYEAKYSKLCRN